MRLVQRVLDSSPCPDLQTYVARGGGRGLDAARRLGSEGVIDEIEAAGLRGRGGAGFSTGLKWRTVARSRSAVATTTVIVNGAEGEPGTFKDRALLRVNPYKVLEGALIAAVAVDASDVVICIKRSFERELAALTKATKDVELAGWAPHVRFRIVQGPSSYLFGEETALLEVVCGRQPFPRVDPPFRRGVDTGQTNVGHSASRVHLAALGGGDAPPALVNNVETMANVVGIVANGADWYRELGTDASPGTLLCTITGHTRRHAVGEVPMGTTLRQAIDLIGGGPRPRRTILAVLSGVANPIIPADLLDTPLSFEAMADAGAGLGAGGFIVFQDGTDMLAVAHRAARFLAVESCGQCEPCKRDGLAIADLLTSVPSSDSTEPDRRALQKRLNSVTRGARCSLASQQERVVGSILRLFGARDTGSLDGATFLLPLVDIVNGEALLDTSAMTKQPDWTHNSRDSARWPAALLGNRPVVAGEPLIREALRATTMGAVVVAPSMPDALTSRLRLVHRELDQLLADTRTASTEDLPQQLGALADRLRAHIDVTQRVLYPIVRRIAGADGELASSAAEHAERSGLSLAQRLIAAPKSSDVPGTIEQLAREVDAHIEAERHQVLPLLRDRLNQREIESLADALNEAQVRIQPPGPPRSVDQSIPRARRAS